MKYKDFKFEIYELDKEMTKEIEEEFNELFKLDENKKKNIKFNNPIVILTLYEKIVDYNLLTIDVENIENTKIIHFNNFDLKNEIKEPKIVAFELNEKEYEIFPVVVENRIIFFKKNKIKKIAKELKLKEADIDIFDIQSEILLEPNKIKLIKNIENKAMIIDLEDIEDDEIDVYQIPSLTLDLD